MAKGLLPPSIREAMEQSVRESEQAKSSTPSESPTPPAPSASRPLRPGSPLRPGMLITFETGATRDDEINKLDYEGFLSPHALEAYAEYMHRHRVQADGVLRDSDNWQKGIPRWRFAKGLCRHYFEFWKLWRTMVGADGWSKMGHIAPLEEKLCAILFNVFGLLHELRIGRSV